MLVLIRVHGENYETGRGSPLPLIPHGYTQNRFSAAILNRSNRCSQLFLREQR